MNDRGTYTLSIIIPLYNEEATIAEILTRVDRVDLSALGLRKQFVVVDDGSSDRSAELVQHFFDGHPEIEGTLIRLETNRGKGQAIQRGLEAVDGEFTIIQDADLEYDPQDWTKLLPSLVAGETDVVFGSRIMPLGPEKKKRRLYQIGIVIAHAVIYVLYGHRFTDVATCYKAFRTDLLRSLQLERPRFDFCVEVATKLLNRKIDIPELPITYKPRYKPEGKKIKWHDFFEAMYTLFRFRFFDPTKKIALKKNNQ